MSQQLVFWCSRWHLGFCAYNYTPTERGFDSFFGYYTGAEDYYKHTRNAFLRQPKEADEEEETSGFIAVF